MEKNDKVIIDHKNEQKKEKQIKKQESLSAAMKKNLTRRKLFLKKARHSS